MHLIRGRLAPVALAWLALQLCLLSAAPVVFCSSVPDAAETERCSCGHGADAMCPMHHRAPKASPDSCACRSANDSAGVVFASLFSQTATLEPGVGLGTLPRGAAPAARSAAHLLDPFLVADAPPPRP